MERYREAQEPPRRPLNKFEIPQTLLGLHDPKVLPEKLRDAILVCIDCEAHEVLHDKITEVGVAVLDTRNVRDLSAGEEHEPAWLEQIQYAHYRIVEHAHLKNGRFVPGYPDSFHFGTTTWINGADVARVLDRIMQSPRELSRAADLSSPIVNAPRNVVLVGHALKNDITYLRLLDFDLDKVTNIVHSIDTQTLAGTRKNPVALQRLLLALGLHHGHLHNAGNDAAHTLRALVVMALRDHLSPDSLGPALEKFAGKLPKATVPSFKAPHVWAGTALDLDPARQPKD